MARLPFRKEGQLSIGELQDQMNLMFSRLWHGGLSTGPFDGQDWAPALDIQDLPEQYVVTAEVPGLKVEDIEVTYCGTALTLAGRKGGEAAGTTKEGWLCRERRFGKFSRSITLPHAVNADGVTATCRNGVLHVVLPKKEPVRAGVVKITVEE